MSPETRKKFNDIFSYGGNNGENTFPIERLLVSPMEILRFCMDWNVPNIREFAENHFDNPDSPDYDPRIEKSCRDDVPRSDYMSEREIRKFCEDYVDYIDLNKLTLFAFYKLKVSLEQIRSMDKEHAFIYKAYMDEMTSSFKELIRKYHMEDTILYLLQESENKEGEVELSEYTGRQLLTDQKTTRKKSPISNSELDKIIQYIEPVTFTSVLDDANLVDIVGGLIVRLKEEDSSLKTMLILVNYIYLVVFH